MTFADIQPFLYLIVTASIAIIAILNLFGNLPQFLAMTEGMNPSTKQKLFRTIVYTAFLVVILFTISGSYIMEYLFKIELRDLRMAGGITLVVMGIKNLLFPIATKPQNTVGGEFETDEEIIRRCIIPMAFPMMVGPGTLSTMIVIASDDGMIATLVATVIAFLFALGLFHISASIEKVFGKLVLHVMSRIMQIFIIAIGVKMFMNGLKDAIVYLMS